MEIEDQDLEEVQEVEVLEEDLGEIEEGKTFFLTYIPSLLNSLPPFREKEATK